MIHFQNPERLYFLAALVPLGIASVFRYGGLKRLLRFFPPSRRAPAEKLRFRYAVSAVFFLLFLGCLIIALAEPQWGSRLVNESRRDAELVFALDVSLSMDVRDAGPPDAPVSRLEQGAALARNLAAALPGTRFGIAIGKGSGILALPLTDDSDAALSFLGGISSSLISGSGTNLESLIDAAAGAFSDAFPSRRQILLLSDGEALSGSFSAAVERALEANITISAVGLGTVEGGSPPGMESGGIVSRLQPEALRSAAGRAKGLYLDGNGDLVLARLVEYFSESPAGNLPVGATSRREPQDQWHIFVLAALAALGIAGAAGKEWQGAKPVLVSLAALFLLGSCSQARGKLLLMEGSFFNARNHYAEAIAAYLNAQAFNETTPYAEYGLGCVYLAMNEDAAALKRFSAAEEALSRLKSGKHTELMYRIRYNSGIIHFQNGDFEAAADRFRRALDVGGGKIEAKRNLELSLLSMQAGKQNAAAPTVEGENTGGGHEVLFDYLRRKEQERWKSREWAGTVDTPGLDY
ncbi:MAG: VWA domain-containing protein [Treponema sp.]|nr:VWA domain-containing protein [Treponema sp.]